MTFGMSILLVFIALVSVCGGSMFDAQAYDTTSVTIDGDANAGNFQGFQSINNFLLESNLTAVGNTATSQDGIARSGNVLYQSGTGRIRSSNVSFDLLTMDNEASSDSDSAISGNLQVWNIVQGDSTLNNTMQANDNTATVSGFDQDPNTNANAISGSQSQVERLFRSDLSDNMVATGNTATNFLGGTAVSGISNNVKIVKNNATVVKDNYAADNTATNLDGVAISGVENNIRRVNNGSVYLDSTTYDNVATSQGGDAVSGVQNNVFNFGELKNGGGDDPNVNPTFVTNDTASGNTATSKDGKAISGVQTNANKFLRSDVELTGYAYDNRATVQDGEGSNPYGAVSGVEINVNKLIDTDLVINAVAKDNIANNFDDSPDSDAIAGVDVLVGDARTGSTVDLNAESRDNFAYSKYGDAVSGIRAEVVGDAVVDTVDIVASDNVATADNGDAIIDTQIIVP
eukprot:TRINITY_DN19246_c0_g1_i11.p1 TRINITY_DN19246_c0_g1~~TRINITY_DN19246_c0_g1_i11.p1  ORF type:complete len:459 (-),score=117.41 TRINITY_DN19246_c0_g1_i11:343-1719(-)